MRMSRNATSVGRTSSQNADGAATKENDVMLVDSKRPVRCPSFTYGRGLSKSLRKAGIDINNWHALAQNREDWHLAINSVE